MSRIRSLARFYFSIDTRSLALFRILFAVTLIYDWAIRWPNLEAFYTSFGVLPIEAPLRRVGGEYHFSLLDGFTSLKMVQLFFLAGLVCYVGLLAGYRTKLFQILSCLFFISVLNRNALIRAGGDLVLASMSLWALFLPLGARFSIDALLQRLRDRSPLSHGIPAINADNHLCRPSLAAFGIVLQIALIYLLTAIDKHGPTWWSEGSAVYYALHLDKFSTPFGKWCARLPMGWLQTLTWSSLALEFAAAPLILLPVLQPLLRRVAIIGLVGLHLGTWATMYLGNFPWAMMSTYALLLLPADWQLCGRWLARWSRPVTVVYTDDDAFLQRVVRWLREFDWFQKIRLLPAGDQPDADRRLQRAIGPWGLVAYDQDAGEVFVGTECVLRILEALPLPWHALGIVGVPGLAWLTDELCGFVAQRRVAIARWLGWEPEPVAEQIQQPPAPSPLLRIRRTFVVGAETLAVGFLLVCVLYESYNRDLAPAWNKRRLKEPPLVHGFVMAAHLNHGWGMFAPDPPKGHDGWWVIEGETRSGKKIDPFTGREPTWEKPAYFSSQFDIEWRRYLSAITGDKRRAYRTYFAKYLTRRHQRENQGGDRLARFRLYYVQEPTKPPGTTEPFPTKRIKLLEHECFASAMAAKTKLIED